jgi:hypothetical protein
MVYFKIVFLVLKEEGRHAYLFGSALSPAARAPKNVVVVAVANKLARRVFNLVIKKIVLKCPGLREPLNASDTISYAHLVSRVRL